MNSIVIAIDLGTSAAKGALVDARGSILETARSAYPTRSGQGGAVEQEPGDWVAALRDVTAVLLRGVPAGAVPAAISLTGQMQDLVCCDAQGRAIRPAILYSDVRSGREQDELAAELPHWSVIAGNEVDASSLAAKWRWLRRHEPGTVATTAFVVCGPAAYAAARLCGPEAAFTDPTTASTTGLFDLRRGEWSRTLCRAAGLEPARLAPVSDPRVVGAVDGLPLVIGAGDAASTTGGMVGLTPGAAYAYLGSSGWTAQVVPPGGGATAKGDAPTVHTLALPRGAGHLRIAALASAGAVAESARRLFLPAVDFAGADALLAARGRVASGLLALPSLQGERFPVRDADLRGAVVGLGPETEPVALYQSMLEAVAFGLRHGLARTGGTVPVTGGGTSSQPWLEILADVLGAPVGAAESADAGVLDAAREGFDALGIPHRVVPLSERVKDVVHPDPRRSARYAELAPVHRTLYEKLAPASAALVSEAG